MIKEDYVSFEVAKLLKEKGFDEPCDFVYDGGKLEWIHHKFIFLGGKISTNSEFRDSEIISAPTIQMAMKWLREKHHIVIDVCLEDYITELDGSLTITYTYTIWHFNRHLLHTDKKDIRYTDATIDDGGEFESYEEACEAGIRYCLENWI